MKNKLQNGKNSNISKNLLKLNSYKRKVVEQIFEKKRKTYIILNILN